MGLNISNMKKIILAALVVASLFASCSSEKTFRKKDGSTFTAKPYGWASKENKVEGVNYELNAPDVVASIIFAPSVIAPALLTAYDVWEPVSYYKEEVNDFLKESRNGGTELKLKE